MNLLNLSLIRNLASRIMLLGVLVTSGHSVADTGQFYFVAHQSPESSVTGADNAAVAVYLRWDVVEGKLPDDMARIRLVRNGVELLNEPVNAVMEVTAIAALYNGQQQRRRLLETVHGLQEEASARELDFSPANFAEELHRRINPAGSGFQRGWSFLSSRRDHNIARARFRGYVDMPGTGVFSYELQAISNNGSIARLGLVEVNSNSPTHILPPTEFTQVDQSQCDLPDVALDHHSVALSWGIANPNPTDQFARSLYISGYDLYRSTENLPATQTVPPVRNLALEAASLTAAADGHVLFTGLEPVNDVLITGGEDRDMLTPEWLETSLDLLADDVQPGDRRVYYLVPRDFTGNYGPTLATLVTVGNKIRPPAPWALRTVIDQTSSSNELMTLSWDAVNSENYIAEYANSRTICNAAQAMNSGVLEFVGINQQCENDPVFRVNLQVENYLIYRFDNFEAASRYKDSDGDGVEDKDERATNSQCSPLNPANTSGALTQFIAQTETVSGREILRVVDPVPGNPSGNIGSTFWYRIASKTFDGRLSFLSAPIRAMVPDRTLPAKPVVEIYLPEDEDCDCKLEVLDDTAAWKFEDETPATGLTASCAGQTLDEPFSASSASCSVLARCGKGSPVSLTAENIDKTGKSCTVVFSPPDQPGDAQFCAQGRVRLKICDDKKPVDDGMVAGFPLLVDATTLTPDTCVSLYENIDGEHSRVATSCGTPDPATVTYQPLPGFFCGYAVTQDANNNISIPTTTSCVLQLPENRKSPATPQPVGLDAQDTNLSLRWRLSSEPVAATLIRLERQVEGEERKRVKFSVPAMARNTDGEPTEHQFDFAIDPLSTTQDEWCARFRSVGIGPAGGESLLSPWSAPLCAERREDNTAEPEYLPWPALASAPQGEPLIVGINSLPVGNGTAEYTLHTIELTTTPLDENIWFGCFVDGSDSLYIGVGCDASGVAAARSLIDRNVHFLAYRQARGSGDVNGDWLQVSPLIEYAHWDSLTDRKINPKSKKQLVAQLNDPFIRYLEVEPRSNSRFVFVDRYPFTANRDYRYQFVYFDADHRITQWRLSPWVTRTRFTGQ